MSPTIRISSVRIFSFNLTNPSAKPEEHGVQNVSAIAMAIASLTDSNIIFDSLGNILDYCLPNRLKLIGQYDIMI